MSPGAWRGIKNKYTTSCKRFLSRDNRLFGKNIIYSADFRLFGNQRRWCCCKLRDAARRRTRRTASRFRARARCRRRRRRETVDDYAARNIIANICTVRFALRYPGAYTQTFGPRATNPRDETTHVVSLHGVPI